MGKQLAFIPIVFVLHMVVYGFNTPSQSPMITPTIAPNTTVWDYAPFPTGLYCSEIEMENGGSSWQGITMGQATLDELTTEITRISHDYDYLDLGDNVSFVIKEREIALTENIPSAFRACIQEGIVTLLSVDTGNIEPNLYLDDMLLKYGFPNVITWSSSSATRLAFWFEAGIVTEVYVRSGSSYGQIMELIYIPYQSSQDYATRWPYNRTSISWPITDESTSPSLPTEQNPFNLQGMVVTITAQPSRTPTPTFTPRPSETLAP
jgi:hypothetical protein